MQKDFAVVPKIKATGNIVKDFLSLEPIPVRMGQISTVDESLRHGMDFLKLFVI